MPFTNKGQSNISVRLTFKNLKSKFKCKRVKTFLLVNYKFNVAPAPAVTTAGTSAAGIKIDLYS